MNEFPKTPGDITPSWLTTRFMGNGLLNQGRIVAVTAHNQPKADRTASSIALKYSADASGVLPDRAFYKYNTNGRDRVEFPRHCAAVREALFYTKINPPLKRPIGPRCFDVGGCFDDGEVYLILEDISERYILVDKADSPSPYGGWACFENVSSEQFVSIVHRLAIFQAHWWDDERLSSPDLASGTGDMLSMVMTASVSFLEQTLTQDWEKNTIERLAECGESDAEGAVHLMRDAILAWPRLFEERIDRSHLTLMHGDLHLRNVLFSVSDRLDPLIVDWEGLTTGVGITDVAHLLTTSMLSSTYLAKFEENLLKQYHDVLTSNGVESYSLEDCYEDYRLALVALVPQAWEGNPFTRSVLSLFRKHNCDQLIR